MAKPVKSKGFAGVHLGAWIFGWLIIASSLAGCATGNHISAANGVGDQPPAGAGVMNVADAAIAGGDPTMALKVSQSVLATDPTNLDALYHEAAAYYAVNRCMDAIAAYKVALSLQPNSSSAQLGIGRCLLKRDAVQAEAAFAAAVADDPRNAVALNDLGIARDLQGHHQAAVAPYQQSLMIDPGNVATEVNLGMSFALAGDGPDALEYLGPLATGQEATPKIREDYAMALVASGRPDEAQHVLEVDLSPDAASALIAAFSTAEAQAQQPALAQAQATAEVAAASAPAQPVATVAPVQVAPVAAPVVSNVQATAAPPTAPQAAPPPAVITPAALPAMAPAAVSIATMAHDDAAPGDQVVR
jgi:Flp pilus assembly protein TadD